MGTIGSRELVKAIRELPRPSAGDLATAVNASRPVVIRRLKALEQEGIIEWIGMSPRDPRAYWRLSI